MFNPCAVPESIQHSVVRVMNWIAASLVAAFFLGLYELFTKHAVHNNAVLPVLFMANLVSAGVWLMLISLQHTIPGVLPEVFSVPSLSFHQHLQLATKSFIVACSWLATYFAMKHLPVSIASPIRATAPAWTFVGALLILGERPALIQVFGVLITICSFIALSVAGQREGIAFHRNKWVGWAVIGMLLGATSTLYDKYLLGRQGFTASTVQAWFSIYLALIFLVPAIGWKLRWWSRHEFHWRWSIVLLTLSLLVSDFVYFNALRDSEALISIVACLRRGNTVVAFFGGMLVFGEPYGRTKTIAVAGILAGIVITILG